MLRISRVLVYIMVLLPCMTRSFLATNGLRRIQHRASRLAPIRSVEPKQELIIGTSRTADSERVEALISCRKGLHKCNTDDRRMAPGKIMWAAFRNGIQLDGIELEDQYLGSVKSSASDTVKAWQKTINSRQDSHGVLPSGEYKMELDVSIRAVQRAAFVIRSLQRILLDPAAEHLIKGVLRSTSYAVSANKTDKTPVTVADFAVQALVIDALSTAFPGDLFIAEEDSALVRADPAICEAVLMIMRAATGVVWTSEKLYAVLDRGSYGTEPASATTAPASSSATVKQRIWVLDPIDGTKGFMRGEHCCTGLGLLVDGVAQLSVLGCPNLNLLRLLQGSSYDDKDITYIDPPVSLHGNQPQYPTVFHPHSGSLYFAVTNQGAFARSLSMPLGAAFEVTTSAVADSSQAKLCESAEAMFGDREVAARTAEHLGVKNDYLRIDGKRMEYY